MYTHLVTFYRHDGSLSVLKLNERVADVSTASLNTLGRQIHGSHLLRVECAAI